jgi:2'-5' RNA ligase
MIAKKEDVLFLCSFVPPSLNDEIDDAMRGYGLRGRMIEPERRHISLFGFGAPTRGLVDRIDRAMESLRSRSQPFGVIFERLVIGARQSLLLPAEGETIEGLERYDHQCLTAFAEQGLHLSKGSSSEPHVTLGYDGVDRGTTSLYPVSWRVQDVSLVISHRGEHRYTFLRRFPLDAAADGRSCQ